MNKGNALLYVLLVIVVLSLGALGYVLLVQKGMIPDMMSQNKSTESATTPGTPAAAMQEIKSLHFVNSTPSNSEVFVASPLNVIINFNFDLAEPSAIIVEKDGQSVGVGGTVIDENKLAMRQALPNSLTDGSYKVSYKACWPDATCHDGVFYFTIDSKLKTGYVDMRGKTSIEVDMDDISFNPSKVVISKGTKVTWINKESVAHYVNTDPHAGHNHYIYLNSKALSLGNSYSYTFEGSGEYPYHCSAHASVMLGRILVE